MAHADRCPFKGACCATVGILCAAVVQPIAFSTGGKVSRVPVFTGDLGVGSGGGVPAAQAQSSRSPRRTLRESGGLPGARPHNDSRDRPEAADDPAASRPRQLQKLVQGRREFLKLSQEAVAARLEMSTRAYGNWERGVVKEWTDHKLYLLAGALEMTSFQTERLFWLAVDRAPQPELRSPVRQPQQDASTMAFLEDYSVMINALSLPAFLIDHRWNVRMANSAFRELFRDVHQHPSVMPADNFLRFGLFHPDACRIFEGHVAWKLSMLAQLAASLERYDDDSVLQAMRREVYLDSALREMYLQDMPAWTYGPGADLLHHGDNILLLRHPDPGLGLRGCRFIEETPRPLQALGLTRITLVLTHADEEAAAEHQHFRAA
ncbi:helix-turn-helix domain-containing protein [Streptomyces sp. NPDC058525]|uniref:helix-turn-helix domain-containing protein n=1 Tax=Streptomyces sp. NPDC058525 TaxID=3346538 RepID=UPI0036529B07